MTTEHDKAVALAEKHGARVGSFVDGKTHIMLFPEQLAAMLSDHRQQAIEELVRRSGKMPSTREAPDSWPFQRACDSDEVRIASLEARLEYEKKKHNESKDAYHETRQQLQQSEARVRDIEQAILAKLAEKAEPVGVLYQIRHKFCPQWTECDEATYSYNKSGETGAEVRKLGIYAHPPTTAALVEAAEKELFQSIYDTAWRNSAGWSGVDHTLADMGSRPYKQERDEAIRAAIEAQKGKG
jgi:hypothetical protein